jgi:hypothetical protein
MTSTNGCIQNYPYAHARSKAYVMKRERETKWRLTAKSKKNNINILLIYYKTALFNVSYMWWLTKQVFPNDWAFYMVVVQHQKNYETEK